MQPRRYNGRTAQCEKKFIELLADPVWQQRSTRWLAKEAGIDECTARRIRKERGGIPALVVDPRGVWHSTAKKPKPLPVEGRRKANRRRIIELISDQTWGKRSSNWIAMEVGVSATTVAAIREELGLNAGTLESKGGRLKKQHHQKRAMAPALNR